MECNTYASFNTCFTLPTIQYKSQDMALQKPNSKMELLVHTMKKLIIAFSLTEIEKYI